MGIDRTLQRSRLRRTTASYIMALLVVSAGAAAAQTTGPTKGPEHAEETEGVTPRGAMRGYLQAARAGNYERAATYLNLRRLPPRRRRTQGPVLARQLEAVLDRTLWVDLDSLSADPEGDRQDGLPPGRDLVGTIPSKHGTVDVLLERVRLPGGARRWKIAASTVARVPALYAEFGYGPLARILPAPFFELRVLQVQLWQWIGLLLLVAVAAVASWLLATVAVRAARVVVQRSRTTFDDALLEVTAAPLRLGIALLLFAVGAYALELSVPVQRVLAGIEQAFAILVVTWLLLRVIDVLAGAVEQRFGAQGKTAALSVVPLGRRTVKVVLGTLAVIAMLQNLGFNVTGILAGLGVGGLAVALAAQKSVENLFGGLTLIADQPVRVGDFCRFGDRIGTVEDVGLRSTRVRTLDRTVVSIPNAQFSSMELENYSRRDRIWLHTTIGLRYETTPDQLRYVLVELKKLLLAHPKVDPDPARPRFVAFGAYSLDIEIFAYIRTTDYGEFLAIREDIYLRIMDIVAASGTGFAFPSQTIYAGTDTGLDQARSRAAESEVQRWRAENRLPLPDPPPEAARALAGTLDYPPKGSAVRR